MSSFADWFQEQASGFTGQLLPDESLSRHTYYRIGGPAKILAVPRCKEDLEWLGAGIAATGARYFVLGSGSNCLVSDEGFDGVVIKTGRLNLTIEASADRLEIGASVAVSSLLRRASQEGWGGFEFLTGIPGSIGGAVRMNAGTHLGETASRIRRVDAYLLPTPEESHGVWRRYEAAELRFEYRKNLFLPANAIVHSTRWEFTQGDAAAIKSLIDSTLQRRKATQPLDFPSCGSVFKNPRAACLQAWQVIDQLGLRGHKIGKAQIAEMHSNWILNLGGARAEDVRGLIQLARSRAKAELGVEIEEEVVYVGF